MVNEDLHNLSLDELIDMLVEATQVLLELMNKNGADGILIRDKRKEVQAIQYVIDKKKTSKSD